jgi:hypothetical protein
MTWGLAELIVLEIDPCTPGEEFVMQVLRAMFSLIMLCGFAAHAAPQVDVIASGLSNPRGIAFAPNGQLFVAEAGRGGNGGCVVLGDGQTACYGETGALTRIDPRGVEAPLQVISGLPSLAAAPGFGAIGPHSVSFVGTGNGQLVIGLGAQAQVRNGLGAKSALLGHVLQVNVAGAWKLGADVAAFEAVNNPVPGGADSNPYGVVALPSRHVVADAGANALFEVAASGAMRTLAAFPTRSFQQANGATVSLQAVPTSVVEGPDGWLYVGQLTGVPFQIGAANIYRVPPQGGVPQVFAGGFTHIVGLAFDARGRLHVLQIASGAAGPFGPLVPPGKLIRLEANGSQTLIYDGLVFPGGLAIGPDGAAYVTNFGIVPGPIPGAFPTGGQVLRIALD